MSEFKRARICEGDSTTAGGVVLAGATRNHRVYGRPASFAGDPVQCPACHSLGVTECVQPYRPQTGPDGRQRCLDGDLCRCKCTPPPRLVALEHRERDCFDKTHVLNHPGCEGWLAYTGHVGEVSRFDQFFVVQDRATGQPFGGYAYALRSAAGTYEGLLNADGATVRAYSEEEKTVELVYLVQTEIGLGK